MFARRTESMRFAHIARPRRRPALLLGLILAASSCAAAAPPPSVTVAPVVERDVAPPHGFIGRVAAIQSVQIVPRVTAFIDAVAVAQGSDVKAGETLFELQKAQYQAAVEAAQAQLASARAAVALAQVTFNRASRLASQQFETQANLDQASATLKQSQASVNAAEANLAQAELNLSYCTIASPIAGRIGAVSLTKGNLVTPATPPLATVVQLDPIRVQFPVPDRQIVAAQRTAGASSATIASGLVVYLELPGGTPYGEPGRIAFLGNQVDPQTGTVNVFADFPNPRALLLPGAFVRVDVQRAEPRMALLVPVQSVQTEQNGSFVLVVDSDDKVRREPVTLGAQIGHDYIVTKGLAAGERVIIEGVQKARPGETVTPVNGAAEAGTTAAAGG